MRWLVRRSRDGHREPADDEVSPNYYLGRLVYEGDAHRAGQRHVDGRAHSGLRLRGVPFDDPHDRRTRPSIMLEYAGKVVLIDTTRRISIAGDSGGITRVDAVLYTHTHADHILGIDDLRPLSYRA